MLSRLQRRLLELEHRAFDAQSPNGILKRLSTVELQLGCICY
jgi:hypothetical protein